MAFCALAKRWGAFPLLWLLGARQQRQAELGARECRFERAGALYGYGQGCAAAGPASALQACWGRGCSIGSA